MSRGPSGWKRLKDPLPQWEVDMAELALEETTEVA